MNGKVESRKSTKPRFIEDEAFKLLRSGELEAFHRLSISREEIDFSNSDLRGTDLRMADLSNVILRGSYLRDADLRGIDLSNNDLSGCSLSHAKVSGTLFPANLTADEIRLSLEFGTRLRSCK